MWDEEDGFFYDVLRMPDGQRMPLKVRSMVGLIPLFAVETLEPRVLDRLSGFQAPHGVVHRAPARPDPQRGVHGGSRKGRAQTAARSSIPSSCGASCQRMLDENEFLSPYGIRSLSRSHRDHPYVLCTPMARVTGGLRAGRIAHRTIRRQFQLARARLVPAQLLAYRIAAEVSTTTWATNIRWSVPPAPAGWRLCGKWRRKSPAACPAFFCVTRMGIAPSASLIRCFKTDPNWRDLVLFYEYFHGDTGAGLGASHQTGWTGLVAKLLQQSGE